MRLHTFMDNSQLRVQPFDIVLDVCLQRLKIQPVLMQGVQDLLFCSISRFCHLSLWKLPVSGKCTDYFREEVYGNIGGRVQCGWLEVLKTSVVEDLSNRSLEGCTTDPWRHQGPILGHGKRTNVLLFEWLWVVLLELVLICLFQSVRDRERGCTRRVNLLVLGSASASQCLSWHKPCVSLASVACLIQLAS